jgi:hypothetical protein
LLDSPGICGNGQAEVWIERESELGQFFATRFHQDWVPAYGCTYRAVDDYLARARPETVRDVLVELAAFRASAQGDEQRIEDELYPLCDYVLGVEPAVGSWNQWLDLIESLLKRASPRPEDSPR